MKIIKISLLNLSIVLLFSLFSLNSYGQIKVILEKWDNDTPKVVKIYPGNGKDTSKYQVIHYYKSGKKLQDANYVDSHPEGKVCYWYEGDKCQQEAIYKGGKELQSKTFSEDGIIIETHVALEGNYDKDTKFYANGLKQSEIIYDSLGLRQGKSSFWYQSGKLQKQGFFENDKEQGFWKFFDEQGNLKDTVIYRKGIKDTSVNNK
jgi:antitoxin component YwqK of YwqJK toxin-antitoxin module